MNTMQQPNQTKPDSDEIVRAQTLIQELCFWGSPEQEASSKKQSTIQKQKPRHNKSLSTASKELKKLTTNWQSAVDPNTGRTYYYDKVTRQTQWEKPRELKQIERRKKELQKAKDQEFFHIMEANLKASLAKGERIPGEFTTPIPPVREPQQPQQQQQPPHRIRTISGMNEMLLNELQQQSTPTSSTGTTSTSTSNGSAAPLVATTTTITTKTTTSATTTIPVRPSSWQSGRPPLPLARPPPRTMTDHSLDLSPDDEYEEAKQPLKGVDLLLDDTPSSSNSSHSNDTASPPNTTKPLPQQQQHVRRNTTENVTAQTSHTLQTMEHQNVDATVETVCCVLLAHILQSQTKPGGPSPNTVHVNLDIFNDDTSYVPTLQELKEFYLEFYQRSQMEFDSIILSLIYVERLIKETNGALMPRPNNWKSVTLSCMILSSKVWDDLSMWNIDFSNVSVSSSVLSSYSLKKINLLERSVLTCLNFAVLIPAGEYAKYYFLLRDMMRRGGLLVPDVNVQQANLLESRTKHYQHNKLPRRTQSVDWNWFSNNNNNKDHTVVPPQNNNGGPVLQERSIFESLSERPTRTVHT